MRLAIIILALSGTSVAADTEIFRCSLEDGTFAFQEKPCPEPAADANEGTDSEGSSESQTPVTKDDAFDFINPFDEPVALPTQSEATLPAPVSQDRAECEKTTRDAIDAIDLEMRQSAYTKQQGQVYMAELRALTQQLRACKQL